MLLAGMWRLSPRACWDRSLAAARARIRPKWRGSRDRILQVRPEAPGNCVPELRHQEPNGVAKGDGGSDGRHESVGAAR